MKTYAGVVPRDFDKQLEALVNYLSQPGGAMPGIDVAALQADLQAQREGQQGDLEALAQARAGHVKFAAEQAVRYGRYGTAVQTLRAANRLRPDVLTALEPLKRYSGRAKRPVSSETPPS